MTMKAGRVHLHAPRSLGERAADRVAATVGSWRFVIVQTSFMVVWMVTGGFGHDAFPWILLNLMLSTQAGYTGPVLQMAANRQSSINQRRDDHEADEVALLVRLNTRQLEILELLHTLNVER